MTRQIIGLIEKGKLTTSLAVHPDRKSLLIIYEIVVVMQSFTLVYLTGAILYRRYPSGKLVRQEKGI